jgi:hypothetical protein
MTGTHKPDSLFVDTSVEYHAQERVYHGDALTAVHAALNRAAYNALAANRTPVQIEVIVRVAP